MTDKPTPRTDELQAYWLYSAPVAWVDHARQLERENAELREALLMVVETMGSISSIRNAVAVLAKTEGK